MKHHITRKYLNDGYVKLVETMGSDEDIDNAARLSYIQQNKQRSEAEREKLIRFLMRHEHTSPFEMAEVKFALKIPVFVMRQLVRHRTASLNEMSMRYTVPTDDFYLLDKNRVNGQSTNNKQCSNDEVLQNAGDIIESIDAIHNLSYMRYNELLDKGLSRELARGVLPVNIYTELVWKIDMKNFLHFLKLRLHNHAQKEIQELATAMLGCVVETGLFPITLRAFNNYKRHATTFSYNEMKVLKRIIDKEALNNQDLEHPDTGLSKREIEEFLAKLR